MSLPRFYGMVFLLLALLSGCAFSADTLYERKAVLHEGKTLPEEHISHVSTFGYGYFFSTKERTYISAVNNEHLGGRIEEVELLPGRYSFKVAYVEGGPSPNIYSKPTYWGFIDLDLKAGRSYRIEMTRYSIWAIDQASGEVVAGLKRP